MRADTMVLRLGAEADVLVGVQTDSPASLATLRARFAPWLDDSMLDELAHIAPAFEAHLGAADAGARGPRTVPHLRHGTEVLARADSPEPVLHALAQVLGGIHARRPGDGGAWVNLRLFTDGAHAVLTDTPRPHLVADRDLLAAEVTELLGWGVISDGADVLVPAPLGADGLTRLHLAGAVLFRTETLSDAEQLAALAAHSVSPAWFDTATQLVERGVVDTGRTRSTARLAIRDFLTKP